MFLLQGHTPIDLAHQVHSPLLIHMLNHIKQERIRSNSRCLRIINRYRVRTQHTQDLSIWTLDVPPTWFHPVVVLQVFLHFLLCTALFGCVGAILDMNSESWLLKGILLACVISVTNVAARWGARFTPLLSLGFNHRKSWKPTCTPFTQKEWAQNPRSCF